MTHIRTLQVADDLEIDILYDNNKLSYTFERSGGRYGNAVKLPSRSIMDVTTAALQLFVNAISTRDAVDKKNNKNEDK